MYVHAYVLSADLSHVSCQRLCILSTSMCVYFLSAELVLTVCYWTFSDHCLTKNLFFLFVYVMSADVCVVSGHTVAYVLSVCMCAYVLSILRLYHACLWVGVRSARMLVTFFLPFFDRLDHCWQTQFV